jgi:hypothetical protein
MPYSYVPHHPEGTTIEEFRKLLELRRQALADATRPHGLGQPLPVAWRHGWQAHIRILERCRDGSLRALIVVTGPRGETPYTRAVRLVAQRPLPWMVGRE